MSSEVQIRYKPVVLGVGGSFKPQQISGVGAFLCTTSGSITITNGNGVVVLNAFPVTAGQRLELNIYLDGNGSGTIALTSAAGTLLYW